jgi:hypothetical protein
VQQQNPYVQSAPQAEKRQRKPLLIVNPETHETVKPTPQPTASVAPTPTPSLVSSTTTTSENRSTESTTDSSVSAPKPANDINKAQKQSEFRHQFAKLLSDTNAPTDKVYRQKTQ